MESVFELLTDDPVELERMNKLNDLMNRTVDTIKENNWTPQEAADNMGFSLEWVTDIQNGKISKFYLDNILGLQRKIV